MLSARDIPKISETIILAVFPLPIIGDQLSKDRSPFSASVKPGRPLILPGPSCPPIILEYKTSTSPAMLSFPQYIEFINMKSPEAFFIPDSSSPKFSSSVQWFKETSPPLEYTAAPEEA